MILISSKLFIYIFKRKKAIIDYYNGNFYNHLKKQYDNSDLIILSTKYSVGWFKNFRRFN